MKQIDSQAGGVLVPNHVNRRPAFVTLQIGVTILFANCAAGGIDALEKMLFGAIERRQWSGVLVFVWVLAATHERLLRQAWTAAKTYGGLFWILFFAILLGTAVGIPARSWIDGTGLSGNTIADGLFMGLACGLMVGMLLTRSTDDRYGPKSRKGAA